MYKHEYIDNSIDIPDCTSKNETKKKKIRIVFKRMYWNGQ